MIADHDSRDPAYVRRADTFPVIPVGDTIWTRRGLWASVMLGAVIGFAATVLMGTFGAATGISAGAAVADASKDRDYSLSRETNSSPGVSAREGPRTHDQAAPDHRRPDPSNSNHPSNDPAKRMNEPAQARTPEAAPAARVDESRTETVATTKDERDAMKGAAVGGALWMVLTAVVAGMLGGYVAGRFAQVYSNESAIVGAGSWAVGVLIMVGLAAFGASGMLGGIGAGAGELANRGADVDAETAKAAAAAAGIAAWGFFAALLIGLGASILGAKKAVTRRLRHGAADRPIAYGTTTPVSPAMP